MNTAKEFKTTKERVLHILETEPRTRNSDKWLTYRVFEDIARENGRKIFIPFELWAKFPAFETVKRVRAKIQNKHGLFLPTDPEVIAKRKHREKEVSDIFSDGAL